MSFRLSGLAAALAVIAGPAAAVETTAKCEFTKVAELPVVMRGTQPTIPVKINGRDAVMAVGSGTFFSAVRSDTVSRFGMSRVSRSAGLTLRGMAGGSAPAQTSKADEFVFAGAPLKKVEFLVSERASSGSIDGVVGQNILGFFDVEYDLANGVIRLFKTRGCAKLSLAYWAADKPISIARLEDGQGASSSSGALLRVVTKASIGGKPIKASWSTGTSVSYLSKQAAARAGIKPSSEGVKAAEVTYDGLGGSAETSIAPFDSFEIGGEQINKTRLRVVDFDLTDSDMILGADFFLSHRVLIANSQDQVFFTYNGGPVFRFPERTQAARGGEGVPAAPSPPLGGEAALTVQDLIGRGSAAAARRDYDAAMASLNQAIAKDKGAGRAYFERGRVHLARGQGVLALADLEEARRLMPADIGVLMLRGWIYLSAGDEDRARADFDAAVQIPSGPPDLQLQIASSYSSANRQETAIRHYDAWIAANPKSNRLAGALNSRCWTRAIWGQQLEVALADCDAALKLEKLSSHMDSRGLVLLRMGRLREAVAQYDAALRLQPKLAWSLYGRGLAKKGLGDAAGGEADIAAASALSEGIAEWGKRYGIDGSPPKAS